MNDPNVHAFFIHKSSTGSGKTNKTHYSPPLVGKSHGEDMITNVSIG